MKIGIDISQISYTGTGVSRFTEGLVKAILEHDSINTWVFFYSSLRNSLDLNLKKKIRLTKHKCIEYKLPPSMLTILWNTLHRIPIETFLGKLDFFISSDWTEPPTICRKMTVIHDLAFMRYPETIHPTILINQRKRLRWVIKESKFIVADSIATKNDLIHYFTYEKNNIYVIYPGINEKISKNEGLGNVLSKYHLNKPFIFTVGKIEPRKNLKRLLIAYNKLIKNQVLPDLVIAGQKGWEKESELLPLITDRVHFLGHISDTELVSLYQSCLFFIYPSLWEGFGYPVVEAMQYGAPVATSNSSSLAEIAGESALLFDPLDIDSITNSIKQLIENKDLRLHLQKRGTIRAQDFSWKSYYQQLIRIINKNILLNI